MLNGLPVDQPFSAGPQDIQQSVDKTASLRELLDWCNAFIQSSRTWRRNSFEQKWHIYQRNADAIFDPVVAANKESWQSKAFYPLTPSHRETIHANIYKTMMGAKPILEMRPRGTPQNDQSENMRDLITRELEKSEFEIQFNSILDDADTYGSGLARVYFDTKKGDRKVRVPIQEPVNVYDPSSVMRAMSGNRGIIGYEDKVQEVVTYRGMVCDPISIWDVFPDPRALDVKGNAIALRYPITYGAVIAGIASGQFFEEARSRLLEIQDGERDEDDVQLVKSDRQQFEVSIKRTDYQKNLKCYELFAKLPKKWIYINGEEIDDPEKLVPARIIFHRDCVLAVETNDQYDGEAPIIKMDYVPVNGQFYGKGIPEMLQDLQGLINDTINQRVDNVALVLNKMFAVIEKAVVDRNDFVSKPGGFIRVNGKNVTDIRQALMPIDMGSIPREAYVEPQEYERMAQERTSASKVTLGTAGQTRDTNDTARGMQLVQQSANEKFAYVGMLVEFKFLNKLFRDYWKNIYSNIQPQDVVNSIGEKRAQSFVLLSPEQIENDYAYEPQGIFTQDNKNVLQQRLQGAYAEYQNQPFVNPMAFFNKTLQTMNEDPDAYKYTPEEMQQMLIAQNQMEMVKNGPIQQGPAPQGNGQNPGK